MPKTKPPYSEEFRREAVDLYVSSGRSPKGAPKISGPRPTACGAGSSLCSGERRARSSPAWAGRGPGRSGPRADGRGDPAASPGERASPSPARDPKKAASILAEDPQAGMRW